MHSTMQPVSAEAFRDAMGSFASSVTVLTTLDGDTPVGMTATAFSSVSLAPPLCLVCVDGDASCLPAVRASGVFAMSVLAATQQTLSERFASSVEDRFADIPARVGPATGCPLLEGAVAQIECRLHDDLPGGDHAILVGEIIGVQTTDAEPLVYWRGRYGGLER